MRSANAEFEAAGFLTDPGSADPLLVVTHSPRSWPSIFALHEVARFSAWHPEVAVRTVDVLAAPELTRLVADNLNLGGRYPQAALVVGGQVRWSGAEDEISEDAIERALHRLER